MKLGDLLLEDALVTPIDEFEAFLDDCESKYKPKDKWAGAKKQGEWNIGFPYDERKEMVLVKAKELGFAYHDGAWSVPVFLNDKKVFDVATTRSGCIVHKI